MNTLVLENVKEIDPELHAYLNRYHKDDNVTILNNLTVGDDESHGEQLVLQALPKHDQIVLSSTLGNQTQFSNILKALLHFKNIKAIKILFTPAQDGNGLFLQYLRTQLSPEDHTNLVNLLKQCKLFEICRSTHAIDDGTRQYFLKHEYCFDTVELYYNDEYNMFWHVRQPVVPDLNAFLYKKQVAYISAKKQDPNKLLIKLNKQDKHDLVELIREIDAVVEYQIERCEMQNDTDYLIPEKKRWQKIIQNISQQL